MRYIFILFLLVTNYSVFAQGDNPSGGIAIPRQKNPQTSPEAPSSGTPSPFSFKPPQKPLDPRFKIGGDKEEKSPMSTESEYGSRSNDYADRVKIKPEGNSGSVPKGDISYGEIRTKSPYLEVPAWDFGAQDGDRIRVWINDVLIIQEFTLTNYSRVLMLNLKPGFNKIEFEAMNQGSSGPNTAAFRLIDSNDKLLFENEWNLITSYKARIIVIRETE